MVAIGSEGRTSMCASTDAAPCEKRREPRRASAVAAAADDLRAVRRVIFMAGEKIADRGRCEGRGSRFERGCEREGSFHVVRSQVWAREGFLELPAESFS